MSIPTRPEKLLSAIIQLTSQRDRRGLDMEIAHIIHDLFDFNDITLYKILPSGKELIPSVRCSGEGVIIDYSGFGQALFNIKDLSTNPVWEKSAETFMVSCTEKGSKHITVFPIVQDRLVSGLMEIVTSVEVTETEKTIINGLLQIYRNYIALLNDSERDMLTGLMNRKTFSKQYTRMLDSSQALAPIEKENVSTGPVTDTPAEDRRDHESPSQSTEWLALLDIDHFKKVNDTFGHLYGDEVLLLLAGIMESTFRNSDGLFRFGGEEFVILLGRTTEKDAMNVFNRLREAVESYDFPTVKHVTISMGITVIRTAEDSETVLDRADQALYRAKESGRNKIVIFDASGFNKG